MVLCKTNTIFLLLDLVKCDAAPNKINSIKRTFFVCCATSFASNVFIVEKKRWFVNKCSELVLNHIQFAIEMIKITPFFCVGWTFDELSTSIEMQQREWLALPWTRVSTHWIYSTNHLACVRNIWPLTNHNKLHAFSLFFFFWAFFLGMYDQKWCYFLACSLSFLSVYIS